MKKNFLTFQKSFMKWIKSNLIRIIFVTIIIFTGLSVSIFCRFTFFETSSLFYIFSTIAQTVGAILGIISAVLVFTVGTLDSKRDALRPTIIEAIKSKDKNIVINHLQLEEIIRRQKIANAIKDEDKRLDFILVYSTYRSLRLYKEYILKNITFPIIQSAATIVISIIGLFLTEIITKSIIGLVYCTTAILFCIWTISEITFYIIKLPDLATSIELELDDSTDK